MKVKITQSVFWMFIQFNLVWKCHWHCVTTNVLPVTCVSENMSA